MRYIGVDLHKTLIVACYLEDEKYKHQSFKIEDMEKFKQTLQMTDELAFEATANSSWFYRECSALVCRIVVVNTSKFGAIASSMKKTDKNDATTLAKYLSKNMLPEVRVKTQLQQELETLFNARKLLSKHTTMLKNALHGMMLAQGIAIKSNDLDSMLGLDRIASLCKDTKIAFAATSLIEFLKTLTAKMKEFDHKLEERGSTLPGFKNLKSIYGLGSNTIVSLLASIGKIDDFVTPDKLAAYLGLVPRVRNSNLSVNHGRVTKQGNSLLRGNLTMCALVAVQKNKLLREFYLRIKLKSGYKTAIVATAHKLVTIIYYTLKYGWLFSNFNEGKRTALAINW